jgi:hypothetical protein
MGFISLTAYYATIVAALQYRQVSVKELRKEGDNHAITNTEK